MAIENILLEPEGKTLEFKRDLSSPASALRTIVAFANSAGGRLVIGVEDTSHDVVGVADPLRMEERLANLIADSITPALLVDIDVVPWRRTQLLVAHVQPSPLRPHYLKREGAANGVYVRLGSTNRRADAALVAELGRRLGATTFDEQAVTDTQASDIDFGAVSKAFRDVRSLRRRDLETLGLLVRYQGRQLPSVAGMILFGRDRLRHFPDAWIQVGRFSGTDRSKIADRSELREYPVQAIDAAIAFVRRNTSLGAEIGSVRRRDVPDVPPIALREALINAVVHADYSQNGAPIRLAIFTDRIEIENPGILLPGLTTTEIRTGISRLRNRTIGRVFKELGLIEQWGSGIQRMSAACLAAGLPEPEFVEIGLRFRVTLRTQQIREPKADPVDSAILEHLDAPEGRSTADIAERIKRTRRTTQHRLANLEARGLVQSVGSSANDPTRRWFRVVRTRYEDADTPARLAVAEAD